MLSIDRSVITDTGSALLNSGDPITITSIKTGSGTYTTTEDIKSRTALKNPEYSYTPTAVQVDGVNRTVSGILTNYDPDTGQAMVTTDYTITELGLFATVNSVEVLFAIGVSYEGTEVPAFTGQNKSEIIVEWAMALSGTAQVTVDATGAYALASDLNTHIDNEVLSAGGVHGIRAVDDSGVIKIQVYDNGWEDVHSAYEILDENGTAYPYRRQLQFFNSTITDNEADDITEIHVEGGAIMVTPPTVVVGTYTYNGQPQGPTITWATGMEDYCIVTNATKTDAGSYTLTIALKNTNKMFWSDMTTADKTYSYTIAKQTLTVPTVDDTGLVYDGTAQSPTITGFDSDTMTKSGDVETNAGSYTVTFGLVDSDNYQWGGTNTVSWSIVKANQTITLSETSVTLNTTNTSATVTVRGNQGTISATSSNTSKATASVSGATLTISRVGSSGSNATVTVTVTAASTANYNQATATVSVAVQYLVIVTFANGTDAQIKAMLDAYYNNEITWSQMGWAVGNTRKIHLNAMTAPDPNSSSTWAAQDITIVIVAHDHTNLATSINGHSKACITVQTREVMNNVTTDTHSSLGIYLRGVAEGSSTYIKWSNLYARTYMNSTVLGAIPSGDFKSCIKQSKHYRHTTADTNASEQVIDTLFLPSYPEIFGTAAYTNYIPTSPTEGSQFAYYQISANRQKYGNNEGVSNNSAEPWWNGSSMSVKERGWHWGLVDNDNSGSAISRSFVFAFGLAPAWAM